MTVPTHPKGPSGEDRPSRAAVEVRLQDESVLVGGCRLAVRRIEPIGEVRGPELVFLHQGLGCIDLWRDFPPALVAATGCRALIYDRLGHGRSQALDTARKPGFMHHEALAVLPEVLERFGVVRPLLLGQSDGGSIALIFASAYPQRVAGLVTEAAHVVVEEETLAGARAAVRDFKGGALRQGLARYHGGNTDRMFWGWADIWLHPDFRDWNIESLLGCIRAPLLVIQGEADEYGTLDQVRRIEQSTGGPCETLVVPECGHTPHDQARKTVLAAMARFVRRLAGGGMTPQEAA